MSVPRTTTSTIRSTLSTQNRLYAARSFTWAKMAEPVRSTDLDAESDPCSHKLGDGAASPGLSREQILRERIAAARKERTDGEDYSHTNQQPSSKRAKLDDTHPIADGQHDFPGEDDAAVKTLTEIVEPLNAAPLPPPSPEQTAPYERAQTWSALSRSQHPSIGTSRSIYSYERLNHIQEGTYGVVFRARPRDSSPPPNGGPSTSSTSRDVAVKKLKLSKNGLDHDGFPITSLREIQALTLAKQHSSVIRLHEVCIGKTLDQIFLVMEFMEHDLKTLLTSFHKARTCFAPSEVKTLLHQLLTATKQLHEDWILHRDLKSSNLLMDNRGRLKVADFGLARRYGDPIAGWTPATEPRRSSEAGKGSTDASKSKEEEQDGGMTDLVVTLWYRAPELLLLNQLNEKHEEQMDRHASKALYNGSKSGKVSRSDAASNPPTLTAPPLYDEKIDMWSIGCIFAELLLTSKTGGSLFQGKNEADQLRRIRQILGPPNSTIWPDLALYSSLGKTQRAPQPSRSAVLREEQRIKERLETEFHPNRLTPATLDLLFRLLHYDPKQRIGAGEALNHEYFTHEAPKMAHPDSFGSFPSVAAGEWVPCETASVSKEARLCGRDGMKHDGFKTETGKNNYSLEFDFGV
ncbi:related to CDC28 - cyclin-dependent protein kinase [Ustilago trichophora]|uniref:Related to CDC28 - cyclin-dependent protein kinase n=1 Tax=Ustilago trichophora TaxID=86804 RepID=A0A5C3DT36_9BASI|nr:related to CDC28 - cyclin-dependent protein kinase [Ustilago trichophora]